MIKKAIVLDKTKKEINFKQKSIIQALGVSNFSLLEIYSDKNVKIQDEISTEDEILKRITYKELTTIAKKELYKAIESIVTNNESYFVDFFNNAKPISIRRHQLDLLPMIGKKHRMALLDYMKKHGKFKTFKDIDKIEMMPNPKHLIITRIIEEIENPSEIKYFLFTKPFSKKY
jgi:putative nucleotide binding protein